MSEHEGDTLLLRMGRLAAERKAAESASEASSPEAGGWEAVARQPLDGDAKRRIIGHLEQVLADVDSGSTESAVAATSAKGEAAAIATRPQFASQAITPQDMAPSTTHSSRFAPSRARLRRAAWLIAALLAVTLSTALYVLRGPMSDEPTAPRIAGFELPAYSVQVTGMLQSLRSAPDAPVSSETPVAPAAEAVPVVVGNLLRIVLTPERPTQALPSARAFVRQGDAWQAIDPGRLQVSAQGSVLLEAHIGRQLVVGPGLAELLVTVSSTSTPPEPARAWAEAMSQANPSFPGQVASQSPLGLRAFGWRLEIVAEESAVGDAP